MPPAGEAWRRAALEGQGKHQSGSWPLTPHGQRSPPPQARPGQGGRRSLDLLQGHAQSGRHRDVTLSSQPLTAAADLLGLDAGARLCPLHPLPKVQAVTVSLLRAPSRGAGGGGEPLRLWRQLHFVPCPRRRRCCRKARALPPAVPPSGSDRGAAGSSGCGCSGPDAGLPVAVKGARSNPNPPPPRFLPRRSWRLLCCGSGSRTPRSAADC